MDVKNQKNSVLKEQFGEMILNSENMSTNLKNDQSVNDPLPGSTGNDSGPAKADYVTKSSGTNKPKNKIENEIPEDKDSPPESEDNKIESNDLVSGSESELVDGNIISEKEDIDEDSAEGQDDTIDSDEIPLKRNEPEFGESIEKSEDLQAETNSLKEDSQPEISDDSPDEIISSENTAQIELLREEEEIDELEKEIPDDDDYTEEEDYQEPEKKIAEKGKESVNFSLLSKEDLLALMEEYISKRPVSEIRHEVDTIKVYFYKKLKTEFELKLRAYISEGGNPEDYKPIEDPDELKLRELLKKFRELRIENSRSVEDERQENLRRKYKIIEDIKELANSQESINKTFQEFKDLQDQWREIGPVPQSSLNDLWENYHHHVEKFYDYIKINKELRDLDLKKNLEEKIVLAEKTEALLIESNIVNAFKTLQEYHENWREIGPVPQEQRIEIWERFKEATAKVNRKHQQYYQNLKDQQKKNHEQKIFMCAKAEEIADQKLNSHQDWIRKTNEILELQKVWKTIGFAPRKDNNAIYARFRSACDRFFENKRNFYAQNMEEQNLNYQKKLELCAQAESLQNNTDWKKTTDELIRLQKKWKETGPVPRKYSDQIWKRFRVACDNFFNRKSNHFKNIDSVYDNNLKSKEALINEVENFKETGNIQKDLETLQEYQRKWTEIGFVPIEKKEIIQQKFRDAINRHFDKLDVDDVQKNVLKYENRLENLIQKPRSGQKLKFEREKFMNKLVQLKSDISVYENNIGFFANSSNADEMKRDFELKIQSARQRIKLLEEKINLIDELDLDD